MSENKLKVAIIGAGLGGLAVAITLHKQGINAQVYEKAHQLRLVGAGLPLFPNGFKKDGGDRTFLYPNMQRQVNQSLKIGFIVTNYPKNFGLNY
ncbi:MAG: NAD(P)-binding protein [Hassallia sp. WJT32-NPBG1]|jgi:flavin-dependent dehydrogenase|nr:NAD(P)-binding protein [Hassallia sp. WJT32-NPBG1]